MIDLSLFLSLLVIYLKVKSSMSWMHHIMHISYDVLKKIIANG